MPTNTTAFIISLILYKTIRTCVYQHFVFTYFSIHYFSVLFEYLISDLSIRLDILYVHLLEFCLRKMIIFRIYIECSLVSSSFRLNLPVETMIRDKELRVSIVYPIPIYYCFPNQLPLFAFSTMSPYNRIAVLLYSLCLFWISTTKVIVIIIKCVIETTKVCSF